MKFFNKQRIAHLKDGNLYKYLRYAIGEIVLVVIGILIAIQLNTLNNRIIVEDEMKEILKQLVIELEHDQKRLSMICDGSADSKWIGLEEAVSNCKHSLELIYELNDHELIDSLLLITFDAGSPLINTETSTFHQLQNTAKLYRIKPDTLQRAIISYYTRAEREKIYNDGNNDIIGEALKNLIHLDLIKMDKRHSENFDLNDYPWILNKNSYEYQQVKLSISKILGSQETNLYKMNLLKNQAKDLKDLVINELSKHQN